MKQKIIHISFIILSIMTSGCERIIDVGTPTDMLITETAFQKDETAISAISGLYVSMMSTSLRLPSVIAEYTGMYGDELKFHSSLAVTLAVYANQLQSKDSPTNSIWINAYKLIYQANSIIRGLEMSSAVTEPVKKQLMGEALFIRAFWHFYLINLYGDAPLVTTTDYSITGTMTRTPQSTVYDAIVADLQKSKTLLGDKYVAGNTIDETQDRVRPNKYVASALLSKVYLFREDWSLAEAEASFVISNPVYQMESVENVFKQSSKEAIWQLQMPLPVTFCTFEAQYFTLTSPPASASQNNKSLSARLLSSFSEADLRKKNWIGSYKDTRVTPAVDYFYSAKYRNRTTVVDERTAIFRLSEIYLIRAEALAQQGNMPMAINDSDQTRLRAGLSLFALTQSNIGQQALLDSIQLERKRELFCEWGNRWMDMKRTGTASEIMKVVTPEKGGTWSDDWLVWPLPLADVTNNRKLIQNKGYE